MTRDELVEKATHIVVECMRRDRSQKNKWTPDKMLTSILSLVDMEREACAKICESQRRVRSRLTLVIKMLTLTWPTTLQAQSEQGVRNE
jgi:hypothetical protein